MGNNNSSSNNNCEGYVELDTGIPFASLTGFKDCNEKLNKKPISEVAKNRSIVKGPFSGIWSTYIPTGQVPTPRTGQAHIYDPLTDSIIIAYGRDFNGNYLNDCWSLNLTTLEWKILSSALLSPRSNCTAILHDRVIVFFGGSIHKEFFTDLHVFNIDTCELISVDLSNTTILPRMNSLLFQDDEHIYIWSGFDGRVNEELYQYDIKKNKFHFILSDIPGRVAASSTKSLDNNSYYIFGSTKGSGLIKFHPNEKKFEPIECTGTEPPTGLSRVQMTIADEFLFVIGGERSCDYTYVFALDIKRNNWFAFYVQPDSRTTSISDGRINKAGYFLLPREHSAAFAYSPIKRCLYSVMGSRVINPSPIQIIEIGNALSILHLRNDMLDILDLFLK